MQRIHLLAQGERKNTKKRLRVLEDTRLGPHDDDVVALADRERPPEDDYDLPSRLQDTDDESDCEVEGRSNQKDDAPSQPETVRYVVHDFAHFQVHSMTR